MIVTYFLVVAFVLSVAFIGTHIKGMTTTDYRLICILEKVIPKLYWAMCISWVTVVITMIYEYLRG